MQIKFVSIIVNDQDKALEFYTTRLGFEKMADIPMGQGRWLTVTSPEGIEGVELVLEAPDFPPARAYQEARFNAGIPAAALISLDIQKDNQRRFELGVVFRGKPQRFGIISSVLFEDTCGNLINLVQPVS